MSSFAARSLSWLDMQGYQLSDDEKRRLAIPLKFAPALCALLGAAFVVSEWEPGLFGLATTALAGALLPRHPFDYLYGILLARVLGTGQGPRNTPQRRFACASGAAMLGASGAFFVTGNVTVAWVTGLSFVLVALVVATTNWCLPSLIYNRLLVRIGLPSTPAGQPRTR